MKKTQKQAIAVGASLAAVAAAAAGVYMLTGKNAKNRKKVATWAKDMQKEVVDELHKAGKASKQTYHKVVDQVSKNYSGLKNINSKDLTATAMELKSHWDAIKAELEKAGKTVKKVAPKVAKTVSKKVESAKKTIAKKVSGKKK